MNRYLLSTLILLAASSIASADYVLLIANLNAKPPSRPQQGNVGGQLGIPGGEGIGGGMPPMPGPGGPGGPGFMGGSPMPGTGAEEDADDSPDLIVTILEVKGVGIDYHKRFRSGSPVYFTHKWGGKVLIEKNSAGYEAILLTGDRDLPISTVSDIFAYKYKNTFKEKENPTAEAAAELARWALERGLVDECGKVLDKMAELKLSHTALTAYQKIKPGLSKPLAKADLSKWKSKLIDTYRETSGQHFTLVHHAGQSDVKEKVELLDRSFRGFYYWWALRGVALPVAKEQQVAVLADKDDFAKLKSSLGGDVLLLESFHARRAGVSVVSNHRSDAAYDKLSKRFQTTLWDKGFDRQELLTGGRMPNDIYKAIPKDLVKNLRIAKATDPAQARGAEAGWRTAALLLKSLENEWEQTSLSHKASRQMLFASGLLPRNVNAPQWIQFGMASFFETPLQSPWPTIGGPNPYWLPRFRELNDPKKRKYEAAPVDTLKKIVTDAYFREKPKAGAPGERQGRQLRKAQAASWALTYYLAQKQLPQLQLYFKELSKLPRDLELDEKTLWACFEKAFKGVDLKVLASRWESYIKDEKMEASLIHQKIREFYKEMNAPPKKDSGTGQGSGSGPTLPMPGRGGATGGIR